MKSGLAAPGDQIFFDFQLFGSILMDFHGFSTNTHMKKSGLKHFSENLHVVIINPLTWEWAPGASKISTEVEVKTHLRPTQENDQRFETIDFSLEFAHFEY